MAIKYADVLPYLGGGNQGGNGILGLKSVILTLPDAEFTLANFADEDAHITNILNETEWALGSHFKFEDVTVEAKYDESDAGYKKKVLPSVPVYKISYDYNVDQIAQAKKLEEGQFGMIYGDYKNNLIGVKSGDVVKPFSILPIDITNIEPTSEKSGLIVMMFQFENPDEFMAKWVVTCDWMPAKLPVLSYISIACGAVNANSFTLTATYQSTNMGDTTGIARVGKVAGVTAGNIYLTNAAGTTKRTVTVTATATENVYTISGTGVVATDKVYFTPTEDLPYKSAVSTLV